MNIQLLSYLVLQKIVAVVKIYFFLFTLLTLAEIVFTIVYYFFTKKIDTVILGGAVIYCGSMFMAWTTYEFERYRKKKREFMDSLP